MSALGHWRTCALHQPMFALPPIATLAAFFGMSALGHKRTCQLGQPRHRLAPQCGGMYGSGVPIAIRGNFFALASNSPTIFRTGPKIQLSVITLSASSRGFV